MPRQQKIEKSKDFKGSMKKLIISLKEYHTSIIIALVLAMFSSILSLISPNKLSELADYITACLKPNTEKITEITTIIYENGLTNFYNIYNSNENLDENVKNMLEAIKTEDKQDDFVTFANLSNSILENILDGICDSAELVNGDLCLHAINDVVDHVIRKVYADHGFHCLHGILLELLHELFVLSDLLKNLRYFCLNVCHFFVPLSFILPLR